MENLTVFEHRGVQVVDSRQVAKAIERPHRDLLKTIRTYCAYIAENNGGANDTNGRNFSLVEFFIESSYGDEKNQERPCYLLTKKGCDMVANKLTGRKGVLFTAAYVTAFEQMRAALAKKAQFPAPEPAVQLAGVLAATAFGDGDCRGRHGAGRARGAAEPDTGVRMREHGE